jgi:tRNA threonylcarbamoyladenosine biosynthesis protein TsaB
MILALKTSDATTHLWLYSVDSSAVKPAAELSWESGRALSGELLGRLEEFVEQHGEGWPGVTGIIIFSGPGSFTSLRIGHTVANALADSLSIPVVGAAGDHWAANALELIKTAKVGHPALPHYGAEANITKPKT